MFIPSYDILLREIWQLLHCAKFFGDPMRGGLYAYKYIIYTHVRNKWKINMARFLCIGWFKWGFFWDCCAIQVLTLTYLGLFFYLNTPLKFNIDLKNDGRKINILLRWLLFRILPVKLWGCTDDASKTSKPHIPGGISYLASYTHVSLLRTYLKLGTWGGCGEGHFILQTTHHLQVVYTCNTWDNLGRFLSLSPVP